MDLNDARKKIDVIDDEILKLFEERMAIVFQLSEYKKENSLPILAKGREEEIICRISAQTEPELVAYAAELFSKLFELSKAYQEKQL